MSDLVFRTIHVVSAAFILTQARYRTALLYYAESFEECGFSLYKSFGTYGAFETGLETQGSSPVVRR